MTLLVSLALAAAFASSPVPRWSMAPSTMPNVSLPAAGLRLLRGAHYTVFAPSHELCCTTAVPPCNRQPGCMGTYNHAPLVTTVTAPSPRSSLSPTSVLLVAWHNCPFDEDSPGGRGLYSHSTDAGTTWAPAKVMFDALPGSEDRLAPGQIVASAPLNDSVDMRPFCVLDTASGKYYIKTGGQKSMTCGWDGGKDKDKCCRSRPGNCRWLDKTACEAALPQASDPGSHYCLPCKPGVTDSGCPSGNWTAGPPPPPPVPAVGINGTNIYMSGFVSFGDRQYAAAEGFVGVTSASCRVSEQHGACGPSAGCCSRGLGCCKCTSRLHLPRMMRRVAVDPIAGSLILGKPFWANPLIDFPWAPPSSYFTPLESMDQQSQADAAAFGNARLLDVLPKAPAPRVWSERSVMWQQQTESTAQLALLTRDDGTPSSLRMWASECKLHLPSKELERMRRQFANGELLISGSRPAAQCNWTEPEETNIPDSRSKTCSGTLPTSSAGVGGPERAQSAIASRRADDVLTKFNGTRYLLGNQLAKIWDRDPLTISLSHDGVDFSCVLAVRARCIDGAHCPGPGHEFFPGFGKGPVMF